MDKCRDRKSAISWESEGLWTLNLVNGWSTKTSSCSIRLPTLKFIGLPILKTWLIFGHGIYPSGDLDLLTFELVCNVTCGTDNLPANSGAYYVTFLYRVVGKQTRVRLTTDVITLTLTSPRMSVMRFIVLRPCRLPSLKFVVRKPSCSEDMADFRSRHLSVSWPWPLIFWPLNGVTGHPCHGPPSCQWSACSGMGQTDDNHQRLMSRPMGAPGRA